MFSSGVAGPAAGGGGRLCLLPPPPAPRAPRPLAPPRRGLRQLERGRELEPPPLRPPGLGHPGAPGDQQGRGRGAEEEDVRDHLQQSSLVRSAAGEGNVCHLCYQLLEQSLFMLPIRYFEKLYFLSTKQTCRPVDPC